MANLCKWIFVSLLWAPVFSYAQLVDFSLDELFDIGRVRSINSESGIEASVKFVSDGNNLSLVVKVKDPQITTNSNSAYSDQIHVWLALPRSVYPEDFEYAFHPDYISNYYGNSRGRQAYNSRFFSIYSEYTSQLDKRHFLEGYDYPLDLTIRRDSLKVPRPGELHVEPLHYGMVQYAFYPDQRPPELLNRREVDRVGELMGIQVADLTREIRYLAEYTDHGDGYIITIQFNPRSLGFVPFPSLDGIRVMVDVLDAGRDGVARVVQSSSPSRVEGRPVTFNRVDFATPLNTNESDIPDYLFEDADTYPVCVFSEAGWIPTTIDVDNLVYQEEYISRELMEVKFLYQPLTYERWNYEGTSIETLNFEFDFVNQIPREMNYIRVNNHLIRTERVMGIVPEPPANLPPQWFKFPDRATGMIAYESSVVHPFGWGNCGSCINEKFTIYRIDRGGPNPILSISQGDGIDAYCQVGNLMYRDFYVSSLDWTTEGKTLVIRLKHRFLKEKKRVMASWEDDGSRLEVVLLD